MAPLQLNSTNFLPLLSLSVALQKGISRKGMFSRSILPKATRVAATAAGYTNSFTAFFALAALGEEFFGAPRKTPSVP